MKEQRKQATRRQRRIIFNNDAGDAGIAEGLSHSKNALDVASRQALLDLRTSALADSQVDSIFYNRVSLFCDYVPPILKYGIEPLNVMTDFCRQKKMEIFCSFRMNDTHDASDCHPLSQFKREHPEYLLDTQDNNPPYGGWSGVDYGHPAIRQRAFEEIRQICQRYDIDGIELDFLRAPPFFKKHALGQILGQEHRDAMTDLLRRIRAMTEAIGERRSRPLLVAVRVSESLAFDQAIGLDVPAWLSQDLIDLLVAGGDIFLEPWAHMVQLGHQYDVPVYACLSNSWAEGLGAVVGAVERAGNKRHEAKKRNSIDSYRARAANAWQAGVDGIYLFNCFDPHLLLWRELGDPKTLADLDKVYYTSPLGYFQPIGLKDGERLQQLPTLSPGKPEELRPGQTLQIPLEVGEDAKGLSTGEIRTQVLLQLKAGNVSDVRAINVAFNGQRLNMGVWSEGQLEIEVPNELVNQGANRVEITLAAGASAPISVQDLMLSIRYEDLSDTCRFYGPAGHAMKAFMDYSEAAGPLMGKNAESLDKGLDLLAAARKAAENTIYGQRVDLAIECLALFKEGRAQRIAMRKSAPQALAVERKGAELKLDGNLDKPFWKGAPVYELKDLVTGKSPVSKTTFQVAWSDNSLVFGIRCTDADMNNLSISTTKNGDENIYGDDETELFLETPFHAYYQITINAGGALIELDRDRGRPQWASEAESAVCRGADFWSLEIRIPTMCETSEGGLDRRKRVEGKKPDAAAPWYFNVCRQRVRGKEMEHSAFSPTGTPCFAVPLKFGKLIVI